MTAKKINSKQNVILASAAAVISMLDLFVLYLFKYNSQGMPLSEFSFTYIGNILNLIFTIFTVIGIFLYMFLSKRGFNRSLLISFTIIMNIFLFTAILSAKIRLPLPDSYVFDHPLDKVIVGVLFAIYQFLQFVFLSILWYGIISKELVVLRAIVNTFTVVALLLVFTFIYINFNRTRKPLKPDSNKKFTVAVVLGAAVWSHNSPSPSLAARVDKAVSLYKKGHADKIQLTGSNAPGELSEAEVAYNYLRTDNINYRNVWLENKTVSTSEQIRFIRDRLLVRKDVGKIIIVSDAYHLTRVGEMCNFFRIKASMAASDLKLSFEHSLYYKVKESIALLIFWLFGL